MMVQPPSFAQLEQAALDILSLIRDIHGLENTKLVVAGDLALCKYLPRFDDIKSIDLVISKCSSPGRVRKEMLGHPMNPLVENNGAIFYRHTKGWKIEVKLIPDWLCPYLPAAARPVRHVDGVLPYLSLEDLLVFKVDACGLHDTLCSRQREAREAAALLELAAEHGPLKLDDDKMDKIEQALPDIVECSLPEHDKNWWQRSLGRVPDSHRSFQEIMSDISDHGCSSPASPISPAVSRHPSVYSLASRTSSYSSTTSAHSSSSSISSVSAFGDQPDQKHGRSRKMSFTGKAPRHKRHTSIGNGVAPNPTLDRTIERLEPTRPASPGIFLTNRV